MYVDELRAIDKPDNIYIITPISGEWNGWRKGELQGRVIHYMLELNIDGEHNPPQCIDTVFHGDAAHARTHGYRYVPLGGHIGLREECTEQTKEIDVSQIAYQVYRRQHITNELKALGLRIGSNENLWGVDRTKELLQSRAMLHVHQWDTVQAVAPLRWCIAAAHGLPLITESVEDCGIFGYSYMLQAEYEYLPQFVAQVVKKENRYKLDDYAHGLRELLTVRYTFEKMVNNNL